MSLGLIGVVVATSDAIKDGRSKQDILSYLRGETNELHDEILAEKYPTEFRSSEDGVFGESVDVLINCIDMIRKERPDATVDELEAEVIAYAAKKCEKWKQKAENK